MAKATLTDDLVALLSSRLENMCEDEVKQYLDNIASPRSLGIFAIASNEWLLGLLDAHSTEIAEAIGTTSISSIKRHDIFGELWEALYPEVATMATRNIEPCGDGVYEVFAISRNETEPLYTVFKEIDAAIDVDTMNYQLSKGEDLDYMGTIPGIIAFSYDRKPDEVFIPRFNLLNVNRGKEI